ncbi:MAG: hypothetical protein R3330_05415, partial [Saprospiraceae bacterium]|nr:hypothetical protein [Saprospiraceae bacterium]
MPSLALVTCARYPHLVPRERPLSPLFKALGITAVPAVWNDPQVNWSAFDLIVVRSVWDYHLQYEAFIQWLGHLDNMGAHVLNPTTTMRANAHKSYLRTFQEDGIEIVP